jgi:hypothetical protein
MNPFFIGIYYKIRNRADEPGVNADRKYRIKLTLIATVAHSYPGTNC